MGKKKVVDPFTRKDWYDIKAPSLFKVRQVGKTLVNRTQGTRIASDGLKGRVYEVSLADQLPRDGSDHGQVEVDGEEVADADRGKLRRQDHRWLYSEAFLHRIHQKARDVHKEDRLCTGWTGEEHPQEDDRHHQPGGVLH